VNPHKILPLPPAPRTSYNDEVKTLAVLFSFALLAVAPQVGDDLELTSYLNSRASADFGDGVENVQSVLPPGTNVTVQEVKTFTATGNFGIRVSVDNAPNSPTKWIYFNSKNPAMKLMSAAGTPKTQPQKTDKGQTTQATKATEQKIIKDKSPISSSQIDLASGLNCFTALEKANGQNNIPAGFAQIPRLEEKNQQVDVSSYLLFDSDSIRTAPATASLRGKKLPDAGNTFSQAHDAMDDSTRAVIAGSLRGRIQHLTESVKAGSPSADAAQAALTTCSKVKDESKVSETALAVSHEITRMTTLPGGGTSSGSHISGPANN
jgi:hypothetical protein